ncbi:MAG: amidohydrolase [Phycisphaerae bacterium]|nr:amidohydrolase [Phycisphaerae bacterium]
MLIDTFGAIPDAAVIQSWLRCFGRFGGYVRMFGRGFAGLTGQTVGDLFARLEHEPVDQILEEWVEAIAVILPSVDDYVTSLDAMGVEAVGVWVHVDHRGPPTALEVLAEHCRRYPRRFLPIPSYDPNIPDRPETIARDHERIGLTGVCLLPIVDGRVAEDADYQPIYETCLELDLPVWIHTVNTWSDRHPADFCHPSHADRVACRWPDLRIVLGHGGWPWVAEAVAVAWRHPNVYLEPSAFRYKHLASPGSGWEPLLCYGDTTIADKVLFGSLWPLLGLPLEIVIEEARSLPLRPETIKKWTYDNAKRLYKL